MHGQLSRWLGWIACANTPYLSADAAAYLIQAPAAIREFGTFPVRAFARLP